MELVIFLMERKRKSRMKFTLKIILSVMAIISIIFSIAGMAIINSNFEHSFEQTLSQNIDSYKLERYGLKLSLIHI